MLISNKYLSRYNQLQCQKSVTANSKVTFVDSHRVTVGASTLGRRQRRPCARQRVASGLKLRLFLRIHHQPAPLVLLLLPLLLTLFTPTNSQHHDTFSILLTLLSFVPPANMIEHVVRRGLEYGPALLQRAQKQDQVEMPTWGAVLLCVTFFASMLAISLVHLPYDEFLFLERC